MPRRYKTKKKSTRRRKRPVRSMALQSNYVPSGMPIQRRAKLRYASSHQLTSTAGSMANHKFRANSIYDPDFTSTGHQPMGFDQWATLFNHYVVLGAKITCTFTNNSSATNPCVVGVYLSDDTVIPYSTTDGLIEAKKGQMKPFTADPSTSLSVVGKYSAKKFFNLVDVKDNLSRIGAPINNNPSDGTFWNVVMQARNAGTESINLQVLIEYIVEFSEPVDLTQS